jgi:hypothetical protein
VQDTFNTTVFGIQINSEFERPLQWMTADKYAESSLINKSVVAKDSNSYAGDYAVKMSTKSVSFPGQGTTVRPAAITNGQLTLDFGTFNYSFSGGTAINSRPSALTGYLTFDPRGFARAFISVEAKKWDNTAGEPVVVGSGNLSYSNETDTFRQFSIPISYTSCSMPDSVLITILSGGYDTSHTGTELVIDSLTLDTIGPQGNLPPIAVDDDTATLNDRSVTIDVLANDKDCDGASLGTPTIHATATSGSTMVNGNNTITYVPDPTALPTSDQFSYVVSDGQATDTAEVGILINRKPPKAIDDTIKVVQDSAVEVNVLDNDKEQDFDDLLIESIVTQPLHGTAQVTADDTIRYTADATFSGADSFQYVVRDAISTPLYDTATVRTDVLTGTDEAPPKPQVHIYPNPVSSQLYLRISNKHLRQDQLYLTIMSVNGETMKHTPLRDQTNVVDVRKLPGGLYFYHITRPDGTRLNSGKIIISQ